MATPNDDLHGFVPDRCKVALLIIDMINDFNFIDGEKLFANAIPVAHNILALKKQAKAHGIPVIYVNDNFGKWKSDFQILINHCSSDQSKGKSIVDLLKPDKEDYFVLKPKHSGFYSTTLDILLEYLETEIIVFTGVTSDICVLFTANDAYVRDFKIVVPKDCVAAVTMEQHANAMDSIQRILKADTPEGSMVDFDKYLKAN